LRRTLDMAAELQGQFDKTDLKRIEDVLRKLPLRQDIDIESRLAAAVSRLALVALLAPLAKRGGRHPTFRKAGRRVTEGELQTVALQAEALLLLARASH
jgi:hypothetical protein